jgi:hypothetical protein
VAIGRQYGRLTAIMRGPRQGPQSFTRGLLLADVRGATLDERAAELSVIPKRSHTYFGPYKPGSAQRIPPLIPTGYGRDYASEERVRTALVARARLFRSSQQAGSGQAADQVAAPAPAVGIDAAASQASQVATT